MTKEFRDIVNKSVPAALQTKEFKLLLNLIKEHDLSSTGQLKSFISTKIGALNLELKGGTAHDTHATAQMRKLAKEIDVLRAIKDQFFKFLS